MKKILVIICICILLQTFFIPPMFADSIESSIDINKTIQANQENSIIRKDYLHNFYKIPMEAGRQLFYPDKRELKRNATFIGLLLGTLYFDQIIRDYSQEKIYDGDNTLSIILYNIGTPDVALASFISSYGLSKLTQNRYLEDTVLISFQSLLLTQVSTELIKNTVKRTRPRNSPHNPFKRTKGEQSFISGHASGTWTVATIIAERYPQTKWFSYGLATAVAAARIYEDAHWASDVLAGSIVGYGFGQLTIKLNKSEDKSFVLQPLLSDNGTGAMLSFSF
ncbi:phosphatase PAP2 family protein [Natronospora cellulosivora (SeqCode)]